MSHRILLFLLISAHIGFIGMLLGAKQSVQKSPRPIAVRTISLQPSYPKPSSLVQKNLNLKSTKTTVAPKNLNAKPTKSVGKKKSSSTQQQKKSSSFSQLPSQEFEIPSSILKQLEESIAKIAQKDDKQCKSNTVAATNLPSKVAIDFAQEEKPLPSYTASLITALTQALQLPEYGEVKVKIQVNSMGEITNLLVLQTESTANKLYLEKCLPNIVLPKYNEKNLLRNEQTFTLTFCNAL